MFNRLITRIRDPDKGRENSSPTSPSRQASGSADAEDAAAEGFLCPSCMEEFSSPEELQVHYEESHSEGERHVCPVCKNMFPTTDQLQFHYTSDHALAATANRGDLQTLKQEVAELQTTLKEEKWYSEELKKEVSRLATSSSVSKEECEEILLWKQQIRALEESKSLLSSEIVLLRKQLGEAVETYTSVKVHKDKVEQKAASLAAEKVALQSLLDEEKSVRKSAESRLSELQDLKHNLEVQLQQRPEADDVRVLRQELIQVQTLMDRMTREREEERDTLGRENDTLRKEIGVLKDTLTCKEDLIKKAPTAEAIERLQVSLVEKTNELDAVKFSLQGEQETKTGVMELQKQLAASLESKDSELKLQIERNKDLHKINKKLEADMASLTQSIKQSELRHETTLKDFNEAQKSVQAKEMELVSHQNILSTHRATASEEIGQKNQQISELTLQIEKLAVQVEVKESCELETRKQLSTLQSHFQGQSLASDELKTQLWETQAELEKERRSKLISDEKGNELQAHILQNKETIERLEKERTDLYGKIEAGEGANTAIQQLQHEKDGLIEKLAEQQKLSSQHSEALSNKCEDLHAQLLEVKSQFQVANEKALKMESSLLETNTTWVACKDKCLLLEENLKLKTEQLMANESSSNQQKIEFENQLQSLHFSQDGLTTEIGKLTSKLSQFSKDLTVSREEKQAVEDQLKREMDKAMALQSEADSLEADLEDQKRLLEVQLSQASGWQSALQHSDIEVKRLTEDLSKKQCDFVEQLKNVENLNASQQQEILQLNERKLQLEEQSMEMRASIVETCSAVLLQTKDTKQVMMTTRNEYGALKEHFTQEMKSLDNAVNQLKQCLHDSQLSLTEKSNSEIILLAKVSELDETNTALKASMSEFQMRVQAQEEEIEKQKKIQSVWKQKLEKKEESFQAAQISLKNSCGEVEELRERESGLEAALSKLQASNEDGMKSLYDTQALLLEEKTKNSTIENQHQKLVSDMRLSLEQQNTLKGLLEDHEQLKEDQELTIRSLNLQLAAITENINELNLQKSSIETELFETRKSLSDCEEKIARLESGLVEQKNQFNLQQDCNKKKLIELQEAKELLINQKLEMQNNLSAIEEQLKQEFLNHENNMEMAKQTTEIQQQTIAEYTCQISSLKDAKGGIEQIAEQQKARFEIEMGTMLENLSTLKNDLIGHQEKLGKLQTRNDELSGEKLELEAKLENALDERRALLERCLSSESEWDKLKILTVDLRRKLDDAMSALHELGRENQTLQIETAKLTSRKWASDAEVDSCSACLKLFSVTIRKHHCRNCGNIYCNECSARNATVAAYKKPVRVCDGCFNELSNK